MSKRRKDTFGGSQTELLAMTKELDELHHDVGRPAMGEGISNMIDGMRGGAGSTSRRTFLLGAGAAAGGAAMLAVGGTPALAGASTRSLSSLGATRAAAFPPAGLTGDLAVAAVAASLENLAVFAYSAGLAAATAGKLGAVPPAVAAFATTVKGQHQQHADAWNGVLKAHGKAPVTVTNPKLTPTVQADFAKVTDIAGLAQLAITLETIAAQTYQAETSMLKSKAAIGLSSSIQPVEMQHIAILYYVLGMYPGAQTSSGTPLAFNPTSQAV
ncbi:MAG TPA: ferritin-like domain-containing protein [Acidimicrobiales bacterium]|nr:ferritin-like domain-containing protein [Acidimicrobiales bacterium]